MEEGRSVQRPLPVRSVFFYSSAHPSLTWELDSELVLWVRLQVRLERLDKVKRNTCFARGFQLGLCRLVELCMVIYLGN